MDRRKISKSVTEKNLEILGGCPTSGPEGEVINRKFQYGNRLVETTEYGDAPGAPNCGPPGKRYCYQCHEPVDDVNFNCTLKYNDPMAEILGKCDSCGAPDYYPIGLCPACNGPVYKFSDNFACYHTISGACDFSLNSDHVVEQEVYSNIELANLLVGPMGTREYHGPGEPDTITYQKIVHTESAGWIIETTDCDPEKVLE